MSNPDPDPRDERIPAIVVDALPVVRAGMSLLVGSASGFEVVAQASSGEEAIDALAGTPAGSLVLVGLGLEGPHDAFWLMESIRASFPSSVVLAVGTRSDAATISRALFSGADGFVDKNVDPTEFLDAIASAVSGQMVLAGPPSDWVAAIAGGLGRDRDDDTWLTMRERQVLGVAAEGLTARQIAERLGIRERTVTTHLTRIYGKLGVRTRVAAIRAAAAAGLVSASGLE